MIAAGMLAFPLFSQGIRDSVFMIDAVEIKADRIFLKEEAGMKQTELDTAILKEKVSLSLSDLLSENTPVFIKNHGRGALATASFRGTAASHTRVNWNGININSPMAGMVDFSLIPVYIIDELNLKQVLIVSHEPKLETFVGNVIRVSKNEHVSSVSGHDMV